MAADRTPSVIRPCAELPVVLIDDDEAFRTALGELLRDDSHPVQAYSRVVDLPALRELPPFSVLITGYQLGGEENGLALARRLTAARPDARVIILTAYVSYRLEQSIRGIPNVSAVHKPAQYEPLHDLIHRRPVHGH